LRSKSGTRPVGAFSDFWELKPPRTNKEVIKVLQELHHYHNKQCGIKWVDMNSYIEE
jgi:hypothetical protein